MTDKQQELLPADRAQEIATTGGTSAAHMLMAAQSGGASVEVIETMAKLYREERDDARRGEFNQAMSTAQSEMGRIGKDSKNPQTHSEYASYAAMDRALRPIYTSHGFGLSFGTEEGGADGVIRVVCDVSHAGGWEKRYTIPMPADGKGAKGGDVMTKTHAMGAATTYGMRYLLKMIFNVAIGEDDTDGNLPTETITAEQAQILKGLLEQDESHTWTGQLLKYGGCDSIDELPAGKYKHALKTVHAKIELAAKRGAK